MSRVSTIFPIAYLRTNSLAQVRLLYFTLLLMMSLFGSNRLSAQCGTVAPAALDWDVQNLQPMPVTGTNFSFGANSVKLDYSASGMMVGLNGFNTAAGASYGSGADMQFSAGNAQTITLTFVNEVTNVKFALHDIDNSLGATVTAANAAAVAQTVTMAGISGASLTVTGSTTTTATATATATNVSTTSTDGTVNVDIAGPVKTITITFAKTTGVDDVWLTDITGRTSTTTNSGMNWDLQYFASSAAATAAYVAPRELRVDRLRERTLCLV